MSNVNPNIPITYFLKYFRAKFRSIIMSGLREIGVSPRKLILNRNFLTYYACSAFNWVGSLHRYLF